jgi:hypothetical protein
MKPEKVDKTGRRRPQPKKEPRRTPVAPVVDSVVDDLSEVGSDLQSGEVSSFTETFSFTETSFHEASDSSIASSPPTNNPFGYSPENDLMKHEEDIVLPLEDLLASKESRQALALLSEASGLFESAFFSSLNNLEQQQSISCVGGGGGGYCGVIVHPAGCSDPLACSACRRQEAPALEREQV